MLLRSLKLKNLRAAAHELNISGLLEEEIPILKSKKTVLCKLFTNAVDTIPENEKLNPIIIDVYNEIVDLINGDILEKQQKVQEKAKEKVEKELQITKEKKQKEQEKTKKQKEGKKQKEVKRKIASLYNKKRKKEKTTTNKNIGKEGFSCYGHSLKSQAGQIDMEIQKNTPKKEIIEKIGCSAKRLSSHITCLLAEKAKFNTKLYYISTPKKDDNYIV